MEIMDMKTLQIIGQGRKNLAALCQFLLSPAVSDRRNRKTTLLPRPKQGA